MNKEDSFKEKFKQALISTIKVISEDYKPDNGKSNTSSKKRIVNFSFHDFTKNFYGDSRIILTSKIIAKTRKNYGKKYNLTNLKRYQYNELVLYYIRCAIKKNKTILLK